MVLDQDGLAIARLVDFGSMRSSLPSALIAEGVPSVDMLPWHTYPALNSSAHEGYQSYYTDELAARVADLSGPIIRLMGFSFAQETA